jgi:hypothetical protein
MPKLGEGLRKVERGDLLAADPEVMAGQLATLAVDYQQTQAPSCLSSLGR